MNIISCDSPDAPSATTHRFFERHACQDGDLGVRIDFRTYGNFFTISVGLYAPSTSIGYLHLLRSNDLLIVQQFQNLLRQTLHDYMALLAPLRADSATDTSAVYYSFLPKWVTNSSAELTN
jgi:hypothetical protein